MQSFLLLMYVHSTVSDYESGFVNVVFDRSAFKPAITFCRSNQIASNSVWSYTYRFVLFVNFYVIHYGDTAVQSWYIFPARIAPLYVREPLPFTEYMNIFNYILWAGTFITTTPPTTLVWGPDCFLQTKLFASSFRR